MTDSMRKLRLLAHTLRHLKLGQLLHYFIRRELPAKRVSAPPVIPELRELALQPPLPVLGLVYDGAFSFLNVRRELGLQNLDWSPDDVQRLWRYNLHYFDYLRQYDLPLADKQQLLADWIAGNPQQGEPGWEPFTTSLRIVNWVFFFQDCRERGEDIAREYLASLYEQALWLERNDERHILANHYFENLKALVFAGSFFTGEDAQRWLKKGLRGLARQLHEQFLPDGGHYERTPQYHALMLENVLDLYNLADSNPHLISPALTARLHDAAGYGLAFLEGIVFPDGELPLFNDTAFGIAPSLDALQSYVNSLDVDRQSGQREGLIDFPDSGLYGYRAGEDMLIVDCGDIGPAYQPGHTHCDFLSYELMLAGRRLVVDTGVCEYEPGKLRRYLRSTRAHNTLTVDGEDQSEIWGEFRVARRARKLSATVSRTTGGWQFSGGYRGFYGITGGITHQREISLALAESGEIQRMQVTDTVQGGGVHEVESRIHFHPDLVLDEIGGEIHISRDSDPVAVLVPGAGVAMRVEPTIYCPRFGQKLDNQCVVLSQAGLLPATFGYTFYRS